MGIYLQESTDPPWGGWMVKRNLPLDIEFEIYVWIIRVYNVTILHPLIAQVCLIFYSLLWLRYVSSKLHPTQFHSKLKSRTRKKNARARNWKWKQNIMKFSHYIYSLSKMLGCVRDCIVQCVRGSAAHGTGTRCPLLCTSSFKCRKSISFIIFII